MIFLRERKRVSDEGSEVVLCLNVESGCDGFTLLNYRSKLETQRPRTEYVYIFT